MQNRIKKKERKEMSIVEENSETTLNAHLHYRGPRRRERKDQRKYLKR